jgi:hypothetical protein
MKTRLASARRVELAARLLLRDLLRRRVAVLLLFVVPALFDAVVFVTTGHRDVEVTLAALVEDGAVVHAPGSVEGAMDPGILDDGSRTLDQRDLSLVFLGTAAVAFLVCFLAFYLVHQRRDADARLVLAGYRAHEVLLAKVVALATIALFLGAYETAALHPCVALQHPARTLGGFVLAGLVYGCLGLLVGAAVRQELEGVFAIVLLTNVDVGWLQNPIYYATSDRRWLIELLPGHDPTQLALTGAFDGQGARSTVARSLAYAAVALGAALVTFGRRIRPASRA